MNTPALNLRFSRTSTLVLGLLVALLFEARTIPAQSPPASATTPAAPGAEQTQPGTNAPGGGRRGRVNTLVFPPEETNRLVQLGNRSIGVHDPSTIIKCKDEYWIFCTGNGIESWRSTNLVDWQRGQRVFTSIPSWRTNAVPANRGHLWAPDVIHLSGQYHLYYSVSTFGVNVSALGLVTNPTLDPNDPAYHWTDRGMVLQTRTTNDFNAIDPAVTLDAEGRLWMSFGSFWSGIKLVELDPKSGMRIAPDSPLYSLADYESIEAPFIYRHGGHYYLFVNWGRCCQGANSTYEIRVGRSERITGPYLDKEGKDMLTGGGTLVLKTDGAFIGPGHACILEERGQYWFGCHFYDGTTPRGTSKYAIRPMIWAANGWPEIGPALPK
jgi:arabinan endo-1,5-alpha-L-arabinosidase